MKRIEIKQIHSPDATVGDSSLNGKEDVFILIEVVLAEEGKTSRDIFWFVAATPEGIRSHAKNHPILKRATIVFSEFSWDVLYKTIDEIVIDCASIDWSKTVAKLQRYFQWEYEDYVMDGNKIGI